MIVRIDGYIDTEDTGATAFQVTDALIAFLESRGWSFNGVTRPHSGDEMDVAGEKGGVGE